MIREPENTFRLEVSVFHPASWALCLAQGIVWSFKRKGASKQTDVSGVWMRLEVHLGAITI